MESVHRGACIVIEGIDGAGKSTIARRTAAAVTDVPVRYTSHKEVVSEHPGVAHAMHGLADILWPKDQQHLAGLPSRYRVLLHAAWFSIFSECVIVPRVKSGSVLLMDGWYYKMMARLRVDGYEAGYLDTIFSGATEPDEIIFLDPPPEEVWTRMEAGGRTFGPVEMGMYAGYTDLGRASFLSYQSRTRETLKLIAEERGHKLVVVPGGKTIDETVAIVSSTIRQVVAS